MNTDYDHHHLQGTAESTVPDAPETDLPMTIAQVGSFDSQRAEFTKLADALAADRASIEREKTALLDRDRVLRHAESVRDAG